MGRWEENRMLQWGHKLTYAGVYLETTVQLPMKSPLLFTFSILRVRQHNYANSHKFYPVFISPICCLLSGKIWYHISRKWGRGRELDVNTVNLRGVRCRVEVNSDVCPQTLNYHWMLLSARREFPYLVGSLFHNTIRPLLLQLWISYISQRRDLTTYKQRATPQIE